jgi:hypothetical protein
MQHPESTGLAGQHLRQALKAGHKLGVRLALEYPLEPLQYPIERTHRGHPASNHSHGLGQL